MPFHKHDRTHNDLGLHGLKIGAHRFLTRSGDAPYPHRVGFPPALTAPVETDAAAPADPGSHPLAQPGKWLPAGGK